MGNRSLEYERRSKRRKEKAGMGWRFSFLFFIYTYNECLTVSETSKCKMLQYSTGFVCCVFGIRPMSSSKERYKFYTKPFPVSLFLSFILPQPCITHPTSAASSSTLSQHFSALPPPFYPSRSPSASSPRTPSLPSPSASPSRYPSVCYTFPSPYSPGP